VTRSALSGIGDVPFITRGFAEAWLERQIKRERRGERHWQLASIIIAIGGISGLRFGRSLSAHGSSLLARMALPPAKLTRPLS
jgi:hypothetical protein